MKTFTHYDIDVKAAHDGLRMQTWPLIRSIALAVALRLYKERACYPCGGNESHEQLICRIISRFKCADAFQVFSHAMNFKNS